MKDRIRKFREKMELLGIDAFIAIHNMRYFSGSTAGKAVIIPLRGEPILLCSRLELEQARRQSWIRDARAFSSWRAPLQKGERVVFQGMNEAIAGCLKELGASSVGYDRASRDSMRRIRSFHPAGYRELPWLVLELRMVKSADELALIKKSAKIAVRGMERAAELVEPGRTEVEIAAEAEFEMRKAGSEGTSFPTIVASGRNSWLPHAQATRKRLAKGELVVVDLGAMFEGYCSDMTRTFTLSPTRRQLNLLSVVKRAQRAALSKVKPSAKAADVDGAARQVIARAGYAKFFPHGMGHGVGMEVHELPSLAPISKDILCEGMVITVEPGAYVPGVGGARWEDMVLVRKGGYSSLTSGR
ncbi:MAG: Xaa-Pro peptidase family protein [Candidatus Hadarchaeota archaeon]